MIYRCYDAYVLYIIFIYVYLYVFYVLYVICINYISAKLAGAILFAGTMPGRPSSIWIGDSTIFTTFTSYLSLLL